ncbi:thioesterase II family protein [Nocardia stercoris]|uniref:Thioesterase TesA n=1 Tax=Nocardia stercoris TaxID=2483361 RepID=A0A3M2KY81_9NOCA|nr:alpha/beta fold hydrolase [Nocardia stercoris]RMI30432.1 thioesterase [Nocardia stercoris]
MAIGRTRWLRELRAAPAATAVLVCFPPGGGSAGAYRALAQAVEPDVAVYAVQYPGRQDRLGEPSIPDLAALAAAVTADLVACGPVPKLSLFGHSMGATVAFEVARGLEREGRPVHHLFVSGRIAPGQPYSGALHQGSDEELIAELERLANDPASVAVLRTEPSVAELVLPALRADYQAVETYAYEPGASLRCAVSALVGDEDPTVSVDRARLWAQVAAGEFESAVFPGRHHYLDECLPELAAYVGARLG